MWLFIPNVGRPIRITSLQSVTGGILLKADEIGKVIGRFLSLILIISKLANGCFAGARGMLLIRWHFWSGPKIRKRVERDCEYSMGLCPRYELDF